MINMYDIPLDDPAVWDMICEGNVIGLFQIESKLGQTWCQKIQPRNIEELSAVIALVRPGCLKAMEEDTSGNMKSLTQHYADRKNGKDEVPHIHPVIDRILKPTYNIIVYQEQTIQIATECAGFSPTEADTLRKAMGKKIASLMAEVKTQFITKSEEFGVIDKDLAMKLFSWIEKSNRYSFNKSHSVSYAINTYMSAYIKRYHPKEFYTSWLHYGLESQEPFEEVARIANDAKLHDCEVVLPNIEKHNKNFKIINDEITFGLLAVKGIGEAQVEKLKNAIKDLPENPTWEHILFHVSTQVSSTCFNHLIKVGAIKTTKSRKEMLREFDIWSELTKKEQAGIIEMYNGEKLSSLFRNGAAIKSQGGICANSKRVALMAGYAEALDKPTYSLEDTPKWIADQEKELLGIYLTCAPVDECDTFESNCTCKEFVNNYKAENYIFGVNITDVRSIKIKNGKNIGKKMAYLSIGDASGIISNVVAFPNEYERFGHLLEKDSNVLLAGVRDKKNQNTLIVQQVKGI